MRLSDRDKTEKYKKACKKSHKMFIIYKGQTSNLAMAFGCKFEFDKNWFGKMISLLHVARLNALLAERRKRPVILCGLENIQLGLPK